MRGEGSELSHLQTQHTHMAAASSLMQEERPYGAREGLPGTVVCVRAGSEMGTRNHTHLGLLTAALLSLTPSRARQVSW